MPPQGPPLITYPGDKESLLCCKSEFSISRKISSMPSMTTKSSVEIKVNEVDYQLPSVHIVGNLSVLHVLLNSFFLSGSEAKNLCNK